MGNLITMFLRVFGKLLLWIYNFCHSYALSLILFTLLTKILLFYFSYQGKKSMMQTTAMQGEIEKLRKQYGKDQNRLNEETQKLYEREGINPMGGCVWMMVPMFILMGLYYIIRRPMFYMMALSNDEINAAIAAVEKMGHSLGNNAAYKEMTLAGLMNSDSAVWDAVSNAVGESASKLSHIDFHWLGLDLAKIPTWKFWTQPFTWENIGLTLIPIVVIVTSLLYSQLSQKTNQMNMGKKEEQSEMANQTNRTMMIMMPLMYLWFGYIMPAGMCVYMIFNSVFMAIQEVICAWMLRGKFAEIQAATERRAQEAKEEEKRRKEEIARRRAEEAERMKTKKGRQLAKQQKKAAKGKDRPTEFSRVGVRAYARGRAYDPNRYPVTPYRDPQDVLDEGALEETLSKKGILPQAEDVPAAEVMNDVVSESADTVSSQSADQAFEAINDEISGGEEE